LAQPELLISPIALDSHAKKLISFTEVSELNLLVEEGLKVLKLSLISAVVDRNDIIHVEEDY